MLDEVSTPLVCGNFINSVYLLPSDSFSLGHRSHAIFYTDHEVIMHLILNNITLGVLKRNPETWNKFHGLQQLKEGWPVV